MKEREDFTKGRILVPLLRFAVPVIFALFLQAMYGAVDLLIVGRFASSADVSAVSTGSQIMQTFTGLLTCFLFCFIGFFNGMEMTRFVMIQGVAGAFLMRVPISYLMSKVFAGSLFAIGHATPCSSVLQILLCMICYLKNKKKFRKSEM